MPTTAEAGFPAYEVTNWHGIVGPKGMAPEIVATLNKAINDSLSAPGMDQGLASDSLRG